MIKVVKVWSGVEVGYGEYEGGFWEYETSDEKFHPIQFEVEDTDEETLRNGLIKEIKKLKRRDDVINKDSLNLEDLEYCDEVIFTLNNRKKCVFSN